MAWRIEKGTEDIVIDGFETGIAPSPHKGIANIRNGNISTESGEITASFVRTQQTMPDITATGTLAYASLTTVSLAITGSNGYLKGLWITVSNSSNTGELANGDYYILPSTAVQTGSNYYLSATYSNSNGNPITGFTTGLTANFVIKRNMGQGQAYSVENYINSNGANYQRYYVLDTQGYVWVYDTQNEANYAATDLVAWKLPNTASLAGAGGGIAVFDGWVMVFNRFGIFCTPTDQLGQNYLQFSGSSGNVPENQSNQNLFRSAFVGHQGRCYFTNGNYIGEIFPDSTINNGSQNIQSYCSWLPDPGSKSFATATIITGSLPTNGYPIGSNTYFRLPVVVFTSPGGSLPNTLSSDTLYYIVYDVAGNSTFNIYTAASGGSAITDIYTGSSGTLYFNTFYPIGSNTGPNGSTPTSVYTPQRLILPTGETSQCITEINDVVLVGCKSNVVYPWDQVSTLPSGIINVPESNTVSILTVNQMAYLFAGNNGNIYITDGSTASLVLNIPDYLAGIPGNPATYIEPQYSWGGNMYLRGRIYFSVLDQNTSKAGNVGGIFSFVPTQNLYIGQDSGIALRLESQNSYGTYNGYTPLLIGRLDQSAVEPLYWSSWISDINTPTYGIDYSTSGTSSTSPVIIDLDALPLGTMLNKKTTQQIEFKLSSPLDIGAFVTSNYRNNLTDSWKTVGTFKMEANRLSGYVPAVFEKSQWLQIQIIMNPITSSAATNSFIRFCELRLR